MKVFKDSKKQLNLHPLVVYFLLTSKEKATYGKRIEELNDRPAFNCGIFQFSIVTRTPPKKQFILIFNYLYLQTVTYVSESRFYV